MTRDPAVTWRTMAAVRRTGISPALVLRRGLNRRCLLCRNKTTLTVHPDHEFGVARITYFAEFNRWLEYGWRIRGLESFDDEFEHSNSDFWRAKIQPNMKRDREVEDSLTDLGWRVVRVFASDFEHHADIVSEENRAKIRGLIDGGPR